MAGRARRHPAAGSPGTDRRRGRRRRTPRRTRLSLLARRGGERISRVLHDPRLFLLVAEIDGAACGLMSLDIRYSIARGADLARITALVVSPDHARQGVGRRLLREAEAIARQARVARIEVTSNPRRETALAFYAGCGYSEGSRHFIKLLGD